MAGNRWGSEMREKITKLYVAAAIAEACSWLGLLVGMAVKYGPPGNEIGVKIFGPLHGALFVAYGVLVLAVARVQRWRLLPTLVALACSVPPFATIFFERWAARRGMLSTTPTDESRPLTPVG
jgi:integral membrane protein